MQPRCLASLALISILVGTLLLVTRMTQTNRYVCTSCAQRGMFISSYPNIRAAKIHIGKSPVCRAARQGIQEIGLDTRPTDAMVGGTGAAGPPPDLRHQPPGRRLIF